CILSKSNRGITSTGSNNGMEYFERVELPVSSTLKPTTDAPVPTTETRTGPNTSQKAGNAQTTKESQTSTPLPDVYPTPRLGDEPTMMHGVYWVHKQGEYLP
ncbi:unnamed protein product, partial [Owenia fusiformis]